MQQKDHIKYMKRALELAKLGSGQVHPNPMVGAVIVKNGKIIGEGYHEFFGGPHAEINAISHATEDVKGSTIYVTLEPCSHYGKTPPCADRIIKEGFKKVIVGMSDPNPLVNGKGIEKLKQAGILVMDNILKENAKLLNETYLKNILKKEPFCLMKTAMTLDGKISTFTGDSKWISSKKSRMFVHELRHHYTGIMVGVNTVIKDNPKLNDRSGYKKKSNPIRIVVDSNGRTPMDAKLLSDETPTIIAVTQNAPSSFVKAVKKKGKEIIVCPEKENKVDLKHLMRILNGKGIDSILLEGGSTLNFTAIKEGIVDKVISFISPKIVGGKDALTPVGGYGIESIKNAITLNIESVTKIDDDILVEAYIIHK
jgi:diaminohydroxyphosphoribosylaminopyrimidine deaminase/5-amino-6-(5-phosphoribosylamino)uracil reductase